MYCSTFTWYITTTPVSSTFNKLPGCLQRIHNQFKELRRPYQRTNCRALTSFPITQDSYPTTNTSSLVSREKRQRSCQNELFQPGPSMSEIIPKMRNSTPPQAATIRSLIWDAIVFPPKTAAPVQIV